MAVILKTGYKQFFSTTGIEGLARVDGSKLNILSVVAPIEGKGMFRKFIAQAKEEFSEICIWEIWSDFLPDVLTRYGFVPHSELDIVTCEKQKGYKWSSQSQNKSQPSN